MAVNVHYNDGYTTMCNHHLRDVSLSWQAKGMLSFMFSNREDFKYSINGLTKCASNGETTVTILPGRTIISTALSQRTVCPA